GPASRRARPFEQAQRHRERPDPETGPGDPGEELRRPAASLRDYGALGGQEAVRRLVSGRGTAFRPALGTGVLRLALQGEPVSERRRAPSLRCLAQELRDDLSGRASGP